MKIVDFHGGSCFASMVGIGDSEGSNGVARVALSRGAWRIKGAW